MASLQLSGNLQERVRGNDKQQGLKGLGDHNTPINGSWTKYVDIVCHWIHRTNLIVVFQRPPTSFTHDTVCVHVGQKHARRKRSGKMKAGQPTPPARSHPSHSLAVPLNCSLPLSTSTHSCLCTHCPTASRRVGQVTDMHTIIPLPWSK